MGIVIGIIAFAILVFVLAMFGGIDTIADLVRGRKRGSADSEVIADTRDHNES